MDWTFEDNMVDSLFFCATLIGRGGTNPICASKSRNIRHQCGGS